jgi:hypothetical protein
LPETARAGHALKQTDHVAGDVVETSARCDIVGGIGHHRVTQRYPVRLASLFAIDAMVDIGKNGRVVISGTAEHHAIHMLEMFARLIEIGDTAIDADKDIRVLPLHAIDEIIIERRHFAVFLWRKPLQPGFSRMNPDRVRARRNNPFQKIRQNRFRLLIVHPDPALHRNRHAADSLHCGDTLRDHLRLAHQAGAECAGLNPIRGTADIEVDLVISVIAGDPHRLGELGRIGPAKLQRDGMFLRVIAEQPVALAMDDGIGDDHFGIKQRALRQLPVQKSAAGVGPVDHGGHGEDFFAACKRLSVHGLTSLRRLLQQRTAKSQFCRHGHFEKTTGNRHGRHRHPRSETRSPAR